MSRARELDERLGVAEELTIVCHNNPVPECLASAFALGRLATAVGIDDRRILYSGEISHQQNRAFVNLLGIDLKQFEPDAVRGPRRARCSRSSTTRSPERTTGCRKTSRWTS